MLEKCHLSAKIVVFSQHTCILMNMSLKEIPLGW